METIRNYLNTMFAGLPDTPEVRRAYEELAAMMEDKYTELIEEGRSENEAVGTVISEFGNLDELAQTLGIEDCVNGNRAEGSARRSEEQAAESGKKTYGNTAQDRGRSAEAERRSGFQAGPEQDHAYNAPFAHRRLISAEEVCDYLSVGSFAAQLKALGVFLCITAPIGAVLFGDFYGSWIGDMLSSFGAALLFVFVAAAVACFLISGSYMKPWSFLKTEACTFDEAARAVIGEEERAAEHEGQRQKVIGIVLCIVSAAPTILLENGLGVALMFVSIGAGVFLLVLRGGKKALFRRLRKADTRPGARGARRYVRYKKKDDRYDYRDTNLQSVMSVYWPLVTCVYLGFTLLTETWPVSWIIWIIAGAVKKVIEDRYGRYAA